MGRLLFCSGGGKKSFPFAVGCGIVKQMQAICEKLVVSDGMMPPLPRSDWVKDDTLTAEQLMRMQPLNPFEKLEFSVVSFRDSNLCV